MIMADNRRGEFSRRGSIRRMAIASAIALVSLAGCARPPQLSPKNIRLAESLRTAISAKRTDWLDMNAKAIDDRHKQGELSDVEYLALQSILETARQGDWATAQTQIIRLEKAQRPPSG